MSKTGTDQFCLAHTHHQVKRPFHPLTPSGIRLSSCVLLVFANLSPHTTSLNDPVYLVLCNNQLISFVAIERCCRLWPDDPLRGAVGRGWLFLPSSLFAVYVFSC